MEKTTTTTRNCDGGATKIYAVSFLRCCHYFRILVCFSFSFFFSSFSLCSFTVIHSWDTRWTEANLVNVLFWNRKPNGREKERILTIFMVYGKIRALFSNFMWIVRIHRKIINERANSGRAILLLIFHGNHLFFFLVFLEVIVLPSLLWRFAINTLCGPLSQLYEETKFSLFIWLLCIVRVGRIEWEHEHIVEIAV